MGRMCKVTDHHAPPTPILLHEISETAIQRKFFKKTDPGEDNHRVTVYRREFIMY